MTATVGIDIGGTKTSAGIVDGEGRIVQQARGRLYLAKDARMSRAMFEAGYPQAPALAAYRDPGIGSALSRRLLGH